MNKKILGSVIALVLASGTANAAFTVTTDVAAVQKVANETTVAALAQQVTTVSGNPVITIGALTDVNATTKDIRLALSNGATWNKAPVIATTATALAFGAGVVSADKKTVTYPITTAATAVGTITVTLTGATAAGLFNLTAVPAGAGVTLAVSAFDSATGSFAANAISTKNIFAKVALATAAVTKNTTGNVSDVSAAPSFTAFAAGGATTAACGAGTGPSNLTLTNNTTSQKLLKADVSLTLKGDFSDVTSITPSANTSAWTINTAKTEANSILAADLAGAAASGSLCPTLTFSGTKAIPASDYTVSIATKASSSFTASTPATDQVLVSISRNGSFFSTNSTGGLNTVKITDMSGRAASKIEVSAYDANGVMVTRAAGAPVLVSSVTANSTVSIGGADLTANFPNAVRFDFVVESKKIEVSNVKKTSAGTNVTVYTTAGQGQL